MIKNEEGQIDSQASYLKFISGLMFKIYVKVILNNARGISQHREIIGGFLEGLTGKINWVRVAFHSE